jgi:FixJ family two-component response regulator
MTDTLNIVTLILDDDTMILELIEASLKENGITSYKLFLSDADFIDQLSENMHILVIDHHLNAGISGLNVMKAAIKKNPSVFAIAMSGNYDSRIVVEYLNAGCNRFILKNEDNYLEQLIKFVREGIARFMQDLEFFRRQEILLND